MNSMTKRIRKKIAPLPEDSHQGSKSTRTGSETGVTQAELAGQVASQRMGARKRALQAKSGVSGKSRQDVIEYIVQSTQKLDVASKEANTAVLQLQSSVIEISSGAATAATATEQTQKSMQEIMEASTISATVSDQSARIITNLTTLVSSSMQSVNDMVDGVRKAAIDGRSTLDSAAEVETLTQTVRESVKDVAEIAGKINMSSLNAALESSRAGREGAGFAVVAEEIRRLAARADESANSIASVASGISGAINRVVEEMTRSLDAIDTSAASTEALLGEMQSGVDAMDEVQAAAVEIQGVALDVGRQSEVAFKSSRSIAEASDSASVQSTEIAQTLEQQTRALQGITETSAYLLESNIDSFDDIEHTDSVLIAADELSATILEAGSAAQEVAASVRMISKDAELQSENASKTLPIISALDDSFASAADRANTAREGMEKVQKQLATTRKTIERMIRSISESARNNIETVTDIRKLEDEILRMEGTIDGLTSLNVLTHVLAVNGKIEGAKLEDSSSDFSTVSDEIRQMAETIESAIIKIRSTTRRINSSLQVVSMSIERAGVLVRREVEKTERSVKDLAKVEVDGAEVIKGMQLVDKRVNDSRVLLAPIGQAVQEIASAAFETSSAVNEALSASELQSKVLAEMANVIDDIAMQLGAFQADSGSASTKPNGAS
jgi:methyl-accepting chemotaxis protein